MTHWFFDPDFAGNSTALGAEELRHLASLRIRPGERIVVTNGQGSVFECTMQDAKTGKVEIESANQHTASKLKFHLFQALAKGDRDELALQTSVELGISSVTPLQAENSIVNWDNKAEKGMSRWEQIAISAMKQSQQAWLPKVHPVVQARFAKPFGYGILLLPEAELEITAIPREETVFSVAVGPEGGFSDSEVADVIAAGFTPHRLGPSVLRTSSAGPAAIAALNAVLGGWSIA